MEHQPSGILTTQLQISIIHYFVVNSLIYKEELKKYMCGMLLFI
jgi:hypothetical protein